MAHAVDDAATLPLLPGRVGEVLTDALAQGGVEGSGEHDAAPVTGAQEVHLKWEEEKEGVGQEADQTSNALPYPTRRPWVHLASGKSRSVTPAACKFLLRVVSGENWHYTQTVATQRPVGGEGLHSPRKLRACTMRLVIYGEPLSCLLHKNPRDRPAEK